MSDQPPPQGQQPPFGGPPPPPGQPPGPPFQGQQPPPGGPPPGFQPPPGPPMQPSPAYPPAYPPAPQGSVGVAALVLAIIGMVMCPPVGIVGGIMGGSAKKKARAAANPNTGMATAAQVIGYIFGILGTISLIVVILIFGVFGKSIADDSKSIGTVTDRFINNAATGNVTGMKDDSAPAMASDELEGVSDYVVKKVGTPTSITRTTTSLNGDGATTVTVRIVGSKGSAVATFSMIKSAGEWKVQGVRVV